MPNIPTPRRICSNQTQRPHFVKHFVLTLLLSICAVTSTNAQSTSGQNQTKAAMLSQDSLRKEIDELKTKQAEQAEHLRKLGDLQTVGNDLYSKAESNHVAVINTVITIVGGFMTVAALIVALFGKGLFDWIEGNLKGRVDKHVEGLRTQLRNQLTTWEQAYKTEMEVVLNARKAKVIDEGKWRVYGGLYLRLGMTCWEQYAKIAKEIKRARATNGQNEMEGSTGSELHGLLEAQVRLLETAIELTSDALDNLTHLPADDLEFEGVRITAKNNLAYFLAAQGDGEQKETARKLAVDIYEAAKKYRSAEKNGQHIDTQYGKDWSGWIETYCFVHTQYGDVMEKQFANELIQDLCKDDTLSEDWRKHIRAEYDL